LNTTGPMKGRSASTGTWILVIEVTVLLSKRCPMKPESPDPTMVKASPAAY
jgi:hypothetical protein